MDQNKKFSDDIVHLARLALSGRAQDVQVFIHRAAKRYREELPDLAEQLSTLLREAPTRSTPLRRKNGNPVPVDMDSRLQLVRLEHVTELPVEPIFSDSTKTALAQLAQERTEPDRLIARGLAPTRSALFVGPPGVGKTLAARWLAKEINKPLLILDLSAVMSSFLGRTGNNLRQVLDYAKSEDCILFLDEIDAVAKRRDDNTEIGELKRLVTVLLQEVDDWPETGLLLAATNHPDLLDPAVWRRFEMLIDFPMPEPEEVKIAIQRFAGADQDDLGNWLEILSHVLKRASFSDIEREIIAARRSAAMQDQPISDSFERIVRSHIEDIDRPERMALAKELLENNVVSQRHANELTGVSRDTLRKLVKTNKRKRSTEKEVANG